MFSAWRFDGLSVPHAGFARFLLFCFVLCFFLFCLFHFRIGGLPFTPLERGAASAVPIPTNFVPVPGPSEATEGRLHAAGPVRAGPYEVGSWNLRRM